MDLVNLFLNLLDLVLLVVAGFVLWRVKIYVVTETARHHQLRTPVATIIGLIRALEEAAEVGGMDLPQRKAIYRAIEEQFDLFEDQLHEVTTNVGNVFTSKED